MPKHIPDLRQFQYALAAAEHRSFRRAAAALLVEQSTVSRGVRSLEHRLGIELFERDHAGIRPTAAGDRFLEEATHGIDRLKRAMQRVGAVKRGEHGELAIGFSVPLAMMGGVLRRFRNEHSGVAIEIDEHTTKGCCTAVRQRQIDIAFVAKARADGSLRSMPLHDERMIAVLPSSHRLAGARAVRPEELESERFILSASGLGSEIEDNLLRRLSKTIGEPDIQLHHVGQCALIEMVAQGFGVTIVVNARRCAQVDGVALVPLAGRNVISVQAIWIESNPNPALASLLGIVQTSGRQGPSG